MPRTGDHTLSGAPVKAMLIPMISGAPAAPAQYNQLAPKPRGARAARRPRGRGPGPARRRAAGCSTNRSAPLPKTSKCPVLRVMVPRVEGRPSSRASAHTCRRFRVRSDARSRALPARRQPLAVWAARAVGVLPALADLPARLSVGRCLPSRESSLCRAPPYRARRGTAH